MKRIIAAAMSALMAAFPVAGGLSAKTPTAQAAEANDFFAVFEFSDGDTPLIGNSNFGAQVKKGDINSDGMVTAVDATGILVFYTYLSNPGADEPDDTEFWISDTNSDGRITAGDASLALKYYADVMDGYEGELPEYVEYLREDTDVTTTLITTTTTTTTRRPTTTTSTTTRRPTTTTTSTTTRKTTTTTTTTKRSTTTTTTTTAERVQRKISWTYSETGEQYSMTLTFNKSSYDYYSKLKRIVDVSKWNSYINDQNNRDMLKVIADEIHRLGTENGLDSYHEVLLAANFVQKGFPYKTDQEARGYSEYPKYPVETIYEMCGDCEDKSLLLAGIIRELGYGVALITFNDHMAVGVSGGDTVYGNYYNVDGKKYFYIESTNYGWGIGEIPDDYDGKSAKVTVL